MTKDDQNPLDGVGPTGQTPSEESLDRAFARALFGAERIADAAEVDPPDPDVVQLTRALFNTPTVGEMTE